MLRLFQLFCGILITTSLYSQSYIMGSASLVNTCKGSFFDSGGPNGNYSKNEKFTMTFCSDGSAGMTHIRLSFNELNLAPGDKICFYDGPNTQAKLLSCNDQLPSVFIMQATAANTSGCLTVTFESNSLTEASGWNASISCVASCQSIESVISKTTPELVPLDTGWIDICPFEKISFVGKGNYPQNGLKYTQSDAKSRFEWNFGDGSGSIGQNAEHFFTKPGGYYVSLNITDHLGCKSSNYITKRVRVAQPPIFNANIPNFGKCVGDTIQLKASVNQFNPNANLNVQSVVGKFNPSNSRSDSLALPDGDGTSYKSSIRFTNFTSGQKLTNIADLRKIGINIEHSWMRDLQISLECPNGQTVTLHNYVGHIGNKVYLGEPILSDTINPKPGLGYDYTWSFNAPNDPWLQWANNNPSKLTLPSGDYRPYQALNNLIGCPLNGDWTIIVHDFWAKDNGFIFKWFLDFNPNLFPNQETFYLPIVDYEWLKNSSIIAQTKDSIKAVINQAGTQSYIFRVKDQNGCWHDTTINVNILASTNPNCRSCSKTVQPLQDIVICVGDKTNFNVNNNSSNISIISFGITPNYPIDYTNSPPSFPYISEINVNDIQPIILADPLKTIEKVCINFETEIAEDIQLYLESPDGKKLELSTNNGGLGSNYTNTCFSPKATNPIKSASAPMNGTFQPEGSWSSLTNAVINGKWKLKVSDAVESKKMGKLIDWSISFNADNQLTYSWTPNTGLSCTNCSNPVVSPTSSTTYNLQIKDLYGCSYMDTVKVTVTSTFDAPILKVDTVTQPGKLTFSWAVINGISEYEVSLNNGTWQTVSSNSYTVDNLKNGMAVNLRVRVKGVKCPVNIASLSTIYNFCPTTLQLDSIRYPTCYNIQNGAIFFKAIQPEPSIQYNINGQNIGTSLIASNLRSGSYNIISTDNFGCSDTLKVNIPPKDSINLKFKVDSIKCFDQKGAIFASYSGGKGKVDLLWNTNPPTSSTAIANLPNGTYTLTATDSLGCKESASVTLTAPPKLRIDTIPQPISCFGKTDGVAKIAVSGGTPNYVYIWENGSKNDAITNLPTGTYKVTVVDAKYCLDSVKMTIHSPAPLTVETDSVLIVCKGGNTGRAIAVPKGGTIPYTFQWSDSNKQVVPIAIDLFAGVYTVTVTDKNGCQSTANAIINEMAEMELSLKQTSPTCHDRKDGKVELMIRNGVSPYQFEWSKNTKNDSIITNLGLGLITVTVTDGNGCKKANAIEITAPDTLKVSLSKTNITCKVPNDGTATALGTGGTSPYSFLWNDSAKQPTASAIGLSSGLYTCTITDSNGCKATDTIRVLPPQKIVVDSIVFKSISCFGANDGVIQLMLSGGAGGFSYKWDDPFKQFLNPATNLKAGTYRVTITDIADCTSATSVTINQPDILNIALQSVAVKCKGDTTGRLNSIVSGGTSPYNYFWSTGETTPNVTGLKSGNYSVTVTDKNGCKHNTSSTVAEPVNPLTNTIKQYYTPCSDELFAKARAVPSGGTIPYTFVWSSNEKQDSAILLSNTTEFVTITDAYGCQYLDSILPEKWKPIDIGVLKNQPKCYDSKDGSILLNYVNGGAGKGQLQNYQFQWNTTPVTKSERAYDLKAGKYKVRVSDLQGCSSVFEYELIAPPKIKLTLGAIPTRCYDSNDGSASVLYTDGGTPPFLYRWDINAQSQTSETAINLKSGNYYVTIQDAKGCQSDTFAFVPQPVPVQIERFETTPGLCEGDTLGKATVFAKGGTEPFSYLWSNNQATASVTGLNSGFYQVTVSDFYGCTAKGTTQVKPTLVLDAKLNVKDVVCFGDKNGIVEITPLNGVTPFRYSMDGFNFKSTPKFSGLSVGKYTIQLKDGNGCFWIGDFEINQPLPMQLDLGPDIKLSYGDSVVLSPTVRLNTGKLRYEWYEPYKGILNCLSCKNPVAKPKESVDIELIVTDSLGCEANDWISIDILTKIGVYVPTAFTPNQDSNNDRLMVHGVKGTKIFYFRIFDQWGEQVFESINFDVNDSTKGWDGTFRNADAPSGVYVWYLKAQNIDGTVKDYKGQTTLIR